MQKKNKRLLIKLSPYMVKFEVCNMDYYFKF